MPLKTVVYILPFRYTSDLPFRIYAGNIGINEALPGVLIQVAWISAVVLTGKLWMSKALKKVVVQGG
jgi:ABC-2 type transport system permease protein